MKKFLILLIIVFSPMAMSFGSIITNTNQSVLYLRYPARNASTDMDAVYYNPAGVIQLSNGWHFSLNNQTLFQKRTITNSFPLLNNDTFTSDVAAPIFPSAYVVCKKDKLAFSFGFGPNAGGGSADYKNGLPSFETGLAMLPMYLTSMGLPTTQYSVDVGFKGTSIYFGFQLNASYEINEMVSGAVGLRYIYAYNKYEGSIKNIMINPYHPLLNPNSSMISAFQLFHTLGQPTLAANFSDKAVDAKQVATGFTPILSLNFTPMENMNIGVRYEFNTKLEFENQTTTDDTGMFPDGQTSRHDIPGILAVGIEYNIMPKLKAGVSFNTFFDKNADWEGQEKLVNSNTYDLGLALEYALTKKIALSGGYLWTQVDLSDDYMSDLSHDLSSHSFFLGGRYNFSQNLSLDLGALVANYLESDIAIDYYTIGQYKESYGKLAYGFGIALNYHQ
jgi:long-chain fatty acid transport protein